MAVEVELPRGIELSMMANKELDVLMRRRIVRDILETIIDNIFLLKVFGNLLKDKCMQPNL
jgi:hypothetical protein